MRLSTMEYLPQYVSENYGSEIAFVLESVLCGDHIIDNSDTSKMDSKALSVLLQNCRRDKKRSVQIVVARSAGKGARRALSEST